MPALPVGWVMLGKPEPPQQDVAFLRRSGRYHEPRNVGAHPPSASSHIWGRSEPLAWAVLAHLQDSSLLPNLRPEIGMPRS